MATQIKLRRDSYQNWFDNNPVLGLAEPGYDTTNKKLKIGDGVTTWRLLPYFDDKETDLSAVAQDILPSVDSNGTTGYTLGSPTKKWKELFVSNGSIYIGDVKLSNVGGKLVAKKVINPGLENESDHPEDSDAASEIRGGNGGGSISDFGEGFTDSLDDGKITTSKLYNENPNQGLNNQYVLEVTNGGVVVLPDQSIINGATLKTVAGNYAGITAGPQGADEDSWMWVDNNGATIATKYSTDAHTWTFNNSGALTFPQGTTIATADGTDAFLIDGAVDKDVQIYTYSGPTAHGWTFGTDGSITFPDNTVQTTAYTGTTGDANIWVQTFESVEGAPDDVVAAAMSVEYDVEGNLICVFSHALDYNSPFGGTGSYFSVAKISTTGTILWQKRLGAGTYTDGWGLAVDSDDGSVYIAGSDRLDNESQDSDAMLTKIDLADGAFQWSKIYRVTSVSGQSPVVDVASDGNPVMVSFFENGNDNYIATTKVDSTDGSVIWSRKFDGQGSDYAYGMGVGPNGEVVTVGYVDRITSLVESYPVTTQTGSGLEVLVINRSDLTGSGTFTTNWKVAGSGISEYADVTFINSYSTLTGTVQQGSGATFNITIAGDGTVANPVIVANGGSNYLVGHKIKIPYTAIGGADLNSDIILTVTGVDSGSINAVAAGGFPGGAGTPNTYNGVTGTNFETGSGLVFSLSLDSGSTYTEHPYTFQNVGTNYVTGDVVVIPGTQLGGTSPANDLTAVVTAFEGGVTGISSFSGAQQTTTYRIIVAESEVDFSADGTWTLNEVDVDLNDRMLVIKYNSAGAIQWRKAIQFDDGFNCNGADCDLDSAGNIYVTGQYNKTDENGVALSIVKLNSSGVKQWSRRVTGNCDTFGTSIVVGADDNLYLSGMTGIENTVENGAPYADTHSVLAKYSTAGTVLWQRLLENSSTWSFTGAFFQGGASNLAVKDDYVAVSGGYGDFDSTTFSASVAQVSADGTVFSVDEWDFVASNFSGTFFNDASDITVIDADKTDSDFIGDIIVTEGASMDPTGIDFLIGTVYSAVVGADDRLVNNSNELVLQSTGTVTLPRGGTISEGIVTSNPTIQLTPADPDVASQKLVIKGGFSNSRTDNGITVSLSDIDAVVNDIITVSIVSGTRANQLLYWWIYPTDAGIGDTNSGQVILDGNGDGNFTILIDSDDYEFTVRVSPENNNYDPDNVGVESVTINGEAPAYASPYHLHLTTGDLSETSIFLGTDDHNVRTTVDGGIQITTQTTDVEPATIIITGADVSVINTTYTRAPANLPTWTSGGGDMANDPYIQFVDGEWGIVAPTYDLTPIYVNTGTLYAPLAQWNTNPPLGSVAPTGIYIYSTPPVQEWKFGVDGALTLPTNGVIQSSYVDGRIKTVIAVPHIEDRGIGDWDTATYSVHGEGNGKIVFVDLSQSFRQYLTQRLPDSATDPTVLVNGNISLTYTSNSIELDQITLYVNEAPATDPTTITSIVINTVAENRMDIVGGMQNSMEFVSGSGWGVNIESRLTGDVSIRAGDDIVIQAGNQFRSDSSGGDIDIYGGRGGDADHEDSGGDGGDLDIIAGRGGDASADYSAGDGGVTTIRAGSGGTANSAENRQAGFGANLNLYAGAGGNNDGEVNSGNEGGNVNIYAGASTNNDTGGGIVLQAGASGGTGGGGSITLRTTTTSNANRIWIFDNDGSLTLPSGDIIDETAAGETITLAGAGLAVVNQTYIKTGPLIYTGTNGVTIENQAGDVWVCLQDNDAKYTSMDNLITWIDGTGGLPAPTSTLNTIVRATSITVGAKTWAFGVDGKLRLPTPGDIVDSNGESFLKDIPQNYPTGFSEGVYVLQDSDRGRHIVIDGEQGNSIMVPTDATAPMPIGSTIVLVIKPGPYSIVVGSEGNNAVVIHGAGVGSNMIYELNAGNGGAMATLVKIGTNEWMISGTGLTEYTGP